MSSFYDYEQRVIKAHDLEKPFAPENGQPLKFKIGDYVTFTNDYGVSFPLRITGFYLPEKIDALYATGSRYLLDWECYWMPVKESKLTLVSTSLEANS